MTQLGGQGCKIGTKEFVSSFPRAQGPGLYWNEHVNLGDFFFFLGGQSEGRHWANLPVIDFCI